MVMRQSIISIVFLSKGVRATPRKMGERYKRWFYDNKKLKWCDGTPGRIEVYYANPEVTTFAKKSTT